MSDHPPAWHALPACDSASKLAVAAEVGLSATEAARRKATHGPNRLPDKPPRSPWLLFFAQFKSVLVVLLLLAASLAAAIGNLKDAIVILLVVILNACLGFYQEYRAEQSLGALKQMLPARARVRRDGATLDIAAQDLVPGDVALLEAGDRVPADGRLVRAIGLLVDESSLTGESSPVSKDDAILVAADAPLAERLNVLHMNTVVVRGRAEMIVTATGIETQIGRISRQLAATDETTSPLQIQLDQLGKRLGAIALTLVALLFLLELLRGADLTTGGSRSDRAGRRRRSRKGSQSS